MFVLVWGGSGGQHGKSAYAYIVGTALMRS